MDKVKSVESNPKVVKDSIKVEQDSFFKFNETVVCPNRNSKIDSTANVIYCSSFEISWNKLKNEIFEEPIVLDKDITWVKDLNKQSKNNSISPDYISANVGFGKDGILSKIKAELKEKFGFHYDPNYTLNETDILSIAYLKKDIQFFSELNEDFGNEKLLFNGRSNVKFFGLKHGWANPTYKSELRIYDYVNENDFIFEIGTKSGKDEVFFAKITPELTIEETYQKVLERVRQNKLELLGDDEQVRIPYVKFNIKKEFKEVSGAKVLNEGFETYFIGRAIQIIDFDLNESGIMLKSIGESYTLECITEHVPKKLIFDKPFLIIMKEKGKDDPYFLMWVNNTELMIEK